MQKKMLVFTLIALVSASTFAETVLRRDNGAEPKSIDPQISTESAGSTIIYDIFEGLTKTNIEGNIVAGAAKSWEVSEDGKTYTFHLRDNGKWSDGNPVTAQDFVYAWQRAVNPATASEYAFVLYPVENAEAIANGEEKDITKLGVKAIDDKTFEVHLNYPVPYFLGLTAHYTTYPVPKAAIEAYGDKWTQPGNLISNGAYHLTAWQPQSQITVKKSNTYWDADNVQIDKVIYYPIEDRSSAIKRYRANEIDYVESVPTESLEWAKKEIPNQLKIHPYLATYWYGFNLTKPPFKDNLNLRKALTLAIDRKTLVEKVAKAGQVPAYAVVPPNTANSDPYTPEWAKLDRKAQIAEAQKAYAEAGYSKEKPLKVQVLYNTNEGHKNIAIAVSAMWKQVLGVQTELVNKEWKVAIQDMRQKNTEVYRYAWVGDYNDPTTFLNIFRASSGVNDTGYNNPEYDALLNKASTILDLKERAAVLKQAEKILTDNYAIAPMYHYVSVKLVKPRVKGFKGNIMDVYPSQYLRIE
ncbi:peptide ABC transporter substrate-binding protein [Suttonella ornithocola]|uniref:Periplasmic oligopeptide-binding protein n=1 Tax=Suttonella ornithocola TaxID=279832 RepID=A0A380MV52_9GAMM|nr:peptide ABC transporter substrate-binding protein [Suttonella ornithocola]SUO96459.1 Periplasmic oligopeptide-binding protein precursor [Suttonella ornithocola]